MSKIRKPARFRLWSTSLLLLSLLGAVALRAQEIRPIAEPNQPIRMGRGGYVCEGQITHTPIDAAENWTYEMVQCTGPIYSSSDYAALYAKLSRDELAKLSAALDQLNATSSATQEALNKQAQALNGELRATIEKRFQYLPHEVLLTAAIQNLKKSLIEYVDQRFPKTPPNNPAAPRSSTPSKNQPSPAPNSP
ncbi:MAG: hypothetical protein P4N24_04875 [Acidobacteriota bacterium]|nr:hypothetical protein [Acidobacteriota bacterium]